MSRYCLYALGWLALLTTQLVSQEKRLPVPTKAPIEYARDIKPIFEKHCLRCHGPKRERSRFRVDQRAALIKGGNSGEPAILSGKSEKSYLVHLIAGTDPDLVMPPKGRALSDREIGLIRAWIDQGAKWPGQETIVQEKLTHWSFQPIRRPDVPQIRSTWANNPIDLFVLRKLQASGLEPAPKADARSLMRRARILLTGLPATPQEIQSYSQDQTPDAHAQMIEKLLASPGYGERWARHWLDVVRFAETNGFETNTPRPNAWHYRDYVIDAFNNNKPYDDFIREQLAGDRVGDGRGTGFLVAGPYDTVKSPDINLTLMQRQDELHDMINVTSTAFLGLTVACARCHNHKFDPILQKDYYAFQAVLAGVKHGDRVITNETSEQQKLKRAKLNQRLTFLRQELEEIEKQIPGGKLRLPVNAKMNEESFPPIQGKLVRFQISATNNNSEPCIDELEIIDTQDRNVALASTGATLSSSGNYPNNPKHKLIHLNDGKYGNSRSWISKTRGKGWVQIELPELTNISRIVWGRDREEQYKDRLPTNYEIRVGTLSKTGLNWHTVATSKTRLPVGISKEKALLQRLNGLPKEKLQQAQSLITEMEQTQRAILALSQSAKAYVGNFAQPGPTHRLYRGDPKAKREIVTPGAVTALSGDLTLSTKAAEAERRIALARWMTNSGNPLTARVMVNRIWQHHFGEGLVDTPSDFGKMGTKPTHPELLDWLACALMDSGWSIKHVQRLIANSATWQQSSRPRPKAMTVDAGTRLFWRFPPHRVEAEVIRDSILTLAGTLDRRMGGPGFDVFEPNKNYVRVYLPRKTFGPEHWRRMVYVYKVRMEQDATFGAFDCPDAGQAAAKRARSTTALQALNLLNSPFIIQQANLMADRLQKEVGDDTHAQIRRAFQLTFGRAPTEMELKSTLQFVEKHGLPALCRVLFNTNELLFVS